MVHNRTSSPVFCCFQTVTWFMTLYPPISSKGIPSHFIPLQRYAEGVFSLHFYPSLDNVLSLAKSYSLIPIHCVIPADRFTFHHLFERMKGEYSCLLEQFEGSQSQYSLIGYNPFLLFSVRQGRPYLRSFVESQVFEEALDREPIGLLKELLAKYRSPQERQVPLLTGGAVGYIGYDAVSFINDLPEHAYTCLDLDQIRFMFCDQMLVFDHIQQALFFVANLHVTQTMTDLEIEHAYEAVCLQLRKRVQACSELESVSQEYEQTGLDQAVTVDWNHVHSNFTKEEFMQAVEKAQTYIQTGEIEQVVLSQRFMMDVQTHPWQIYLQLRNLNPSPYMYYLDLGERCQIIGCSPERLVQLSQGKVSTHPIAGTRPRGQSLEEDLELACDLLSDKKECAEHLMLLELGQDELAHISESGSVHIKEYMSIKRFSHVMHIVSVLEGSLKKELNALDCLLACFPAGTVSGSDKRRALEIIAELEKDARHLYAGAVGYLSFAGDLDLCIAIRTVIFNQGKAYVQAGAGIVADSVAEKEWQETKNKAQALLTAIQMVEKNIGA